MTALWPKYRDDIKAAGNGEKPALPTKPMRRTYETPLLGSTNALPAFPMFFRSPSTNLDENKALTVTGYDV